MTTTQTIALDLAAFRSEFGALVRHKLQQMYGAEWWSQGIAPMLAGGSRNAHLGLLASDVKRFEALDLAALVTLSVQHVGLNETIDSAMQERLAALVAALQHWVLYPHQFDTCQSLTQEVAALRLIVAPALSSSTSGPTTPAVESIHGAGASGRAATTRTAEPPLSPPRPSSVVVEPSGAPSGQRPPAASQQTIASNKVTSRPQPPRASTSAKRTPTRRMSCLRTATTLTLLIALVGCIAIGVSAVRQLVSVPEQRISSLLTQTTPEFSATAVPKPTPGASPASTSDELAGAASKLQIGGRAKIATNGATARVRPRPGLSGLKGVQGLSNGTMVEIVDGPTETDGKRWWRVRYESVEGWAAEELLEPLP